MELIKSISIEAEVFKRDNKIKALESIVDICLNNELETNIFYGSSYSNCRVLNGDIAHAKKQIDAKAWGYLMEESGVKQFMDKKGRDEWDHKIYELDVPEFTIENIKATFRVLFDSRLDFMERGIVNIFKKLSWDYKTNQPCRFGKKIIMNNMIQSWGAGKCYLTPSSSHCDILDDFYKFFHLLDGKPEPDTRTGGFYSRIQKLIRETNVVEDEYLKLKWYKKGTAHIEFKRLDIIDKMNGIIAKYHPNVLPPKV